MSASADTIVPPAETSAPGDLTPATGEPPKERWNDILANARTKAAEEALAPYAWAQQIPAQEFQQVQQLARTLSANPIEGLQQLIAEIRKDPQYDAALKSMAARALAQGRTPAAAAEPSMVNVQLEDGSVVAMPRDPAAWLAHQKQQWLDQVKQEFSPVTKTIETLQQREAAAVRTQQAQHFAATTFQEMATTWPGMDQPENQKAVAQAIDQMGLPADATSDQVLLAAERAWRRHVAPQQTQRAEAKLLESLKTKATAATTVNPGSAAASSPRAVTSFFDPALSWK